jgi:hypothetical protein
LFTALCGEGLGDGSRFLGHVMVKQERSGGLDFFLVLFGTNPKLAWRTSKRTLSSKKKPPNGNMTFLHGKQHGLGYMISQG